MKEQNYKGYACIATNDNQFYEHIAPKFEVLGYRPIRTEPASQNSDPTLNIGSDGCKHSIFVSGKDLVYRTLNELNKTHEPTQNSSLEHQL